MKYNYVYQICLITLEKSHILKIVDREQLYYIKIAVRELCLADLPAFGAALRGENRVNIRRLDERERGDEMRRLDARGDEGKSIDTIDGSSCLVLFAITPVKAFWQQKIPTIFLSRAPLHHPSNSACLAHSRMDRQGYRWKDDKQIVFWSFCDGSLCGPTTRRQLNVITTWRIEITGYPCMHACVRDVYTWVTIHLIEV